MIKKTSELKPGDIVFIQGRRATIEMVVPPRDYNDLTCLVRHTLRSGFIRSDAEWLVEDPLDDIIAQAEHHFRRGEIT